MPDRLDRIDRIVIVGTGVAGATAALTLRADGYDGRVILIGEEPDEPYRRPPLSKDVLRGTVPPERTRLKPSSTWADQDIDLITGTAVTGLDPAARRLTLADGSDLAYDRLLLATGGRPRPLPGAEGLDGVHRLRTLHDSIALAAELANAPSVLIIGGGLIGLEVAAAARALGCDVTVLEAADALLGRVLPAPLAAAHAALHRDRGVDLHLGVRPERIERHGDALVVTGTDARTRAAQIVVAAVGIIPETRLAREAGLRIGDGIAVDARCATSAPDMFAAGDVAEQPHLLGGRHRVEHWNNAQDQGAAAARAMLGRAVAYEPVPWCWSDQHGVTLQICGWPSLGTEMTVRGDVAALDYTALFRRDGRLVGAVCAARPAEFRAVRRLIADDPYGRLDDVVARAG